MLRINSRRIRTRVLKEVIFNNQIRQFTAMAQSQGASIVEQWSHSGDTEDVNRIIAAVENNNFPVLKYEYLVLFEGGWAPEWVSEERLACPDALDHFEVTGPIFRVSRNYDDPVEQIEIFRSELWCDIIGDNNSVVEAAFAENPPVQVPVKIFW